MHKRNKLWLSIGAATLAGSTLTGCSPDDDPHQAANPSSLYATSAAHSGEGEGEGEGSAKEINFATDDLPYLTQLGLVRGHLYIGHQLYMEGHLDHAKTHMKHPESELYAAMIPAFEARGTQGFANELAGLANAVNQDQGHEAVDKAYQLLISAISQNEQAVNEQTQSASERLKLAADLLRVAGEEYAIAVVDGKMENAHEYQDALGFTKTAHAVISQLEDGEIKSKADALIENIMPLWPSIIPPAILDTTADEIYGTAARVELLALGL